MPDNPEVTGLLALMLLHDSRRASRLDARGMMIPLEAQNRKRWDRAKISEGDILLRKALGLGAIGPYQLQAAISAVHASSQTWGGTDWTEIAALYGLLYQALPSAVVQINHAVAVSYAKSPNAGLDLLGPLANEAAFADYQPFHAAFADLSARAGKRDQATESYKRAIAMTDDNAMRAFLQGKLDKL
jgi:RNA polymerase sigma-70 factor (ECF subfamily)